jgi:UDP-3-O-[3-hydroxymyristoyl] glucosamine N-acyltransferase
MNIMTEKEISVETLADLVQGVVRGDKTVRIRGVAPLDSAGPADISFLAKANQAELLQTTRAGAVLVPAGVVGKDDVPVIEVKDPYLAVAIIHNYFLARPFVAEGVHPRAYVGEECQLGREISIAPLAVLGNRVQLGERVSIEAGAVIGDDVRIGDDTTIKANATVYAGSVIGNRVTIHSGTVVGSDGYGYAANDRGEHIKRPQVGIVRIDDDVEIGANCCIDRATFGTTWIKAGAKIDNLVQIGHNVVVGENSLLVSQVGISGSTTLGRNVVMGGQAGTAGHLTIGDQVMVAARGGVHNNQPRGAMIGGMPAIAIRQWGKSSAVFAKLPELQRQVRKNTKALAELTGAAEDEEPSRRENHE